MQTVYVYSTGQFDPEARTTSDVLIGERELLPSVGLQIPGAEL